MTKIPLKLKKWPKYYQNPKNDQNTPETQKITTIPPQSKNGQNTSGSHYSLCADAYKLVCNK